MKHLWVKASTEVFEDGGKSIQYTCEDFPGVTGGWTVREKRRENMRIGVDDMMALLLLEIWNYSNGRMDYSIIFKTDNDKCAKELFTLLRDYVDGKENKMEDYKLRMVKQYKELKGKYDKLHAMLVKYDAGKLDFTPTCPIDLLRRQASIMGKCLYILETRAVIEDIDLHSKD